MDFKKIIATCNDKNYIGDLGKVLTTMVEIKKATTPTIDNWHNKKSSLHLIDCENLIRINSITNDKTRKLVSDIVQNELDVAKLKQIFQC